MATFAKIDLVRTHLRLESVALARGDYSDPFAIHGPSIPGLRKLQQRSAAIHIRYVDFPAGGEIVLVTPDSLASRALHEWLAAQVSDHGSHER